MNRFHRMLTSCPRALLTGLLGLCLAPNVGAAGTTPAQQLKDYAQQAGRAPDPAQGREFFNTTHGQEWRCASCHGAEPTQAGRHAATGKAIGPLAPAFNAERFSDATKTEKWFRRNCNDVVGRACTPAEKANVLSWLLTLKP